MKRVLFVDDETNILDGLRRMLRGMRKEWDMHFASSAQEGLDMIGEGHFDIVISDMKMPGMDGADFLAEVKTACPDSIRIILSGHSEKAAVMKSVGPTHQYLAKPCEPNVLKQTIEKAYALRELLESDTLKQLAAELETIPSLPSLYQQITAELQKPRCTLENVGEIIEKDVGMSAKILKLVNSAYFGLLRPVNSVQRAVAFLGIETVTSLVLSAQIFSEFDDTDLPGFSMDALWNHSLQTASFARALAEAEGLTKQQVDDSFLAGMLHDVGTLVLVGNLRERYAEVLSRAADDEVTMEEAEREILHATHGEIGAYVMGIWGLPNSIVEAIAHHEHPVQASSEGVNTVTMVHAADAISSELSAAGSQPGETALDEDYLRSVGLEDRVSVWRETCRKVAEGE